MIRNLYIRGRARRNPKDPKAQRPPGRTKVGKKAIKKLLAETAQDVIKKAEGEEALAEKLSEATISKVSQEILSGQSGA